MNALKYLDSAVLMLVSFAAVAIVVCHHVGLLGGVEFLKEGYYRELLVVLLGAIGLHLAISHVAETRFRTAFEGGSQRLISQFIAGVHGIGVTLFRDAGEQELYLAKRLGEAKVEICDLTWKEKLSLQSAMPQRVKSQKTYATGICRAAKKVPYREVFVFSDERRKEKLRQRLQENCTGYSCRYFPAPCSIPRLQFVIIDREEIVFASSSYPTLCAIRQTELCSIFQAYFETIWSAATPLKEGDVIYQEAVKNLLS